MLLFVADGSGQHHPSRDETHPANGGNRAEPRPLDAEQAPRGEQVERPRKTHNARQKELGGGAVAAIGVLPGQNSDAQYAERVDEMVQNALLVNVEQVLVLEFVGEGVRTESAQHNPEGEEDGGGALYGCCGHIIDIFAAK